MWTHVGAAAAAVVRPRRRVVRRGGADEGAADGARAGVRVLLRPADPQDADVEDARRPALPVPRRAGRRLGGAGRGRGADRPPALERVARLAAAGGAGGRHRRLVHDLGRPERFLNMLRVFKPTSPLSVGSFILAPFSALAGAAAASQRHRPAARGSAGWPASAPPRSGRRSRPTPPPWSPTPPSRPGTRPTASCPFVFAGSGRSGRRRAGDAARAARRGRPGAADGGGGRRLEIAAAELLMRRLGMLAEPYQQGRPAG